MASSVGFRVSVSLHPAIHVTGLWLLPRRGCLPLHTSAFSGRTVDHQLDFHGQLHREVGQLVTCEDFVHIGGGLPAVGAAVGRVGKQGPLPYPLLPVAWDRQTALRREPDDERRKFDEQVGGKDIHAVHLPPWQRAEDAFDVRLRRYRLLHQLELERRTGRPQRREQREGQGIGRV